VPVELLRSNYDLCILGEDQRIFFSKFITLVIAKILRKKVILWTGQWEENYYETYKNIIDKFLIMPVSLIYYKFTDGFIAYGQRTQACLESKGVPSRKIFTGTQFVLPMQLTEDDKNSCSSYLKINKEKCAGKKIILSIGYFSKRKGFDDLIKAYKELDFDDTILVIGGAGAYEEELKLLSEGRNDIYFVGYLEGKDKAYYYSMADIFVFPTHSDAWGLVANEAMMFGLPIITTEKAGCSDELIDNNGFIVAAGDREAIKNKMEALLKSDVLRKKMGERSKQIIKNYDINMAEKTFINAINRVIALKKGKNYDTAFQ
jgi:glycosyltransferase involved in cell wall biosynthesis